ncbi:MAG: hypothetical protein LJF06_10810 [Gemmatimonadetes bacterium]|nr:hypothetical protein [Gemmatimonadota bacterium]
MELGRIAPGEDCIVERNLCPHVDFYSGIIYQGMGLPVEIFPVRFATPRTVGWLAHWEDRG